MDARALADVEGTLVTAGLLAVAVVVVLRLVARGAYETVRDTLSGLGLWLAAVVAVLAMAGSLWFSESAGFPPCELCWYQRIAMYPLAVLLPVAAVRRDRGFRVYALVLAGVGLAVSAWHNVVETFPGRELGSCDPANPCTVRWVEGLGFWTIPRLAAGSFVLIIAVLLLDPALGRHAPAGTDPFDPGDERDDVPASRTQEDS